MRKSAEPAPAALRNADSSETDSPSDGNEGVTLRKAGKLVGDQLVGDTFGPGV